MTDEELIARLREDQPVTQDMASTMQCALQDEAADRIEALTEQLEAARADAKEAEAYAEELERERDEARKYRDAYAECDRIGTQAVRDLETRLDATKDKAEAAILDLMAERDRAKANLAKAVEALRAIKDVECVHCTDFFHGLADAVLAEIEGKP